MRLGESHRSRHATVRCSLASWRANANTHIINPRQYTRTHYGCLLLLLDYSTARVGAGMLLPRATTEQPTRTLHSTRPTGHSPTPVAMFVSRRRHAPAVRRFPLVTSRYAAHIYMFIRLHKYSRTELKITSMHNTSATKHHRSHQRQTLHCHALFSLSSHYIIKPLLVPSSYTFTFGYNILVTTQ